MKKVLSLVLVLALLVACAAVFTACSNPNELVILYEQDNDLKNTYSAIAVNPEKFADTDVEINTAGADALINWLSLASTRALIENYGVEDYGEKLFYLQENATVVEVEIPAATAATKDIALSTTTSVNDSGLMQYLMPYFEEAYGYKVNIASAGTGAAINAAKLGNADLILVHSKSQEDAFVNEGYGRVVEGFTAARVTFMYNFFVLVGPKADPAKVKDAASIKDAFKAIADTQSKFISRGDSSGTHTKEVSLWDTTLGITADVNALPETVKGWYVSAGQGMGACLAMANEQNAYVLSDKATYLTFKKNQGK
ncbi:MAG TPA: substrate-binding domain-containing protein [Clostridia bacterium]|nr:substrate-binding domain-containing protein [Clostridia bacterium]